jgi:hypothetical protein
MKLLRLFLIPMALLLAACQPGAVAPSSPALPTANPQQPPPTSTVEVYPPAQNQSSAEGTYPYPPQSPSVQDGYPAPQSPQTVPGGAQPEQDAQDFVPWDEIKLMILNGQVESVAQFHDLTVVLTLKDGRTIWTKEPAIDEVFKLVEQCGQKCAEIVQITQ